jgi:Pyruvate/2-oxoglutarate dehydrogenase complex, dihydrolipoamide dehydrogenase (E3) component, and related enzymes
MKRYQLAVIGSGSAGREATLLAAGKGLRTALIEKDRLGGVAFHSGCYAVSGLLGCARQFRDIWKSGRFGNEVDLLRATLQKWRVAQSSASTRLAQDFEAELRRLNVDVYQGNAEFATDQILQIVRASGSRIAIRADNIIVATGSRPDFSDRSNPRLVNSDALLRMTMRPRHLAIIGGGHIGCEFASIYRTLGSEVTLFERESRILSGWEIDVAERVTEMLQTRGVALRLNSEVTLDRIVSGENEVRILGPDDQSIGVDLVLVATGRRPNSAGLGLNGLGVDDTSFLTVDAHMRLSRPGLHAVGDVNGISLLDSTAFAQANAVIGSIMGQSIRFDYRWIPRCVHTEPCIAAIGWTQEEAQAEGIDCVAVSNTIFLVSDNPRSIIDPEPTFLKVIVDAKTRRLLGCCVAGDHAPAIVNIATIALRSGMTVDRLREFGLTQPSAAEALMSTLRMLS